MPFINHDDIKLERNMLTTDAARDTIFDALIVAVLALWDEITERTWAQTAYTEYQNSDGGNSVRLKQYPVVSLNALYDDPLRTFATANLIDSDDYYTDTESGIVYCDYNFSPGKGSIRIDYTAGYTDINVPGWLKQILARQVNFWFDQGENKRWDWATKALPSGGGTLSYKLLKGDLLPDFELLAEKNRRNN
jgi:hypothetical protein